MSAHNVVLRPTARVDVEETAAWYAEQGGHVLEMRFVDALSAAFGHVSRHPASGSSLQGMPPDVGALRFWPLKKFPYLIFYLQRDGNVDVWRVLHAERDIPASLRVGMTG